MLNSCLYTGTVRHSRSLPVENTFTYAVFMLYLDLDELETVFERFWLWSTKRPNIAWFRRSDHVGDPTLKLSESLRDIVFAQTGVRPDGPIRLLTNLRYFFYRSNPVSFYYIFDREGETLETVVAEVTNTPWDEQHCYVLKDAQPGSNERLLRFEIDKTFHVSPFLPMDMNYRWRVSAPNESLAVHIQNHRESEKVLDVMLRLQAKSMSAQNLARCLLQYPLMTLKVTLAIYWQALKLWLKKVPIYTHPAKSEREK